MVFTNGNRTSGEQSRHGDVITIGMFRVLGFCFLQSSLLSPSRFDKVFSPLDVQNNTFTHDHPGDACEQEYH